MRGEWKRRWLVAALLAAGCRQTSSCWNIDNCQAHPYGAIPPWAGTYLREWTHRQEVKAEKDDFVFYKHEWYKGGTQLGPYGSYHLNEVLRRLPDAPPKFVVLVQATTDPNLNETRRQVLVQALGASGMPDAASRVVIGFPEAEGLYGDEAPQIFQQMITSQGFGQGGTGFGRNLFPGFSGGGNGFGSIGAGGILGGAGFLR